MCCTGVLGLLDGSVQHLLLCILALGGLLGSQCGPVWVLLSCDPARCILWQWVLFGMIWFACELWWLSSKGFDVLHCWAASVLVPAVLWWPRTPQCCACSSFFRGNVTQFCIIYMHCVHRLHQEQCTCGPGPPTVGLSGIASFRPAQVSHACNGARTPLC